jgi:hypothetical protein
MIFPVLTLVIGIVGAPLVAAVLGYLAILQVCLLFSAMMIIPPAPLAVGRQADALVRMEDRWHKGLTAIRTKYGAGFHLGDPGPEMEIGIIDDLAGDETETDQRQRTQAGDGLPLLLLNAE